MIRPQTIDRAIDVIVAQCDPEQIFVIGSYATGTAKRTSDLDLLIIQASTEAKRKRDERVKFLLAPRLIPVDVNVYTPAEFDEECRQPFGCARMVTELQGKASGQAGVQPRAGRLRGARPPLGQRAKCRAAPAPAKSAAEAVAAVLAERGLPGAVVRSRGPFIDIDARKPPEVLP